VQQVKAFDIRSILPAGEPGAAESGASAWTLWSRALVGLVAIALFGLAFLEEAGRRGGMSVDAGLNAAYVLFTALFFVAGVTGLQSAADCVSSERRQGTLGLLFLTDLKPRTVLAAKLISSSFQNSYALLAALPIFAACILAGGVTGGFLLRSSLVIVYTLLFSTLVGLSASCRTSDAHAAFSKSIRHFVLWNLAPFVSPLYLLIAANAESVVYSIPAVIFGLAVLAGYWSGCCDALSANWRDSLDAPKEPGRQTLGSHGSVKLTARDLRYPPVDETDPATWIISRYGDPRQVSPREFPKPFAIVIMVVCLLAMLAGDAEVVGASYYMLSWTLRFILVVTMCKIAPQGLAETIRGGGAEILLTTPLTVGQLVRGAGRFLFDQFRPILKVFLISDGVVTIALAAFGRHHRGWFSEFVFSLIKLNALTLAVLATAGFFGVWMGLRYQRMTQAVIRTALMQIVAPMILSAVADSAWILLLWYAFWVGVARNRIAEFVNACRDGAHLTKPDFTGR